MYKMILFDFWDTLAEISNLDSLLEETKQVLVEDRYEELKKQFTKWHLVAWTKEQFIEDLDKKISIGVEELPIIERFIDPDNYAKYPETDVVLQALKNEGIKLVLVTNSPPTSKNAFNRLNLAKFFDRTVFSCDVGVMKPDREIFKIAIKGFNIESKKILMVGNSMDKDVNSAIAAGLNAILIDRKGLIQYDNKITTLLELVKKYIN